VPGCHRDRHNGLVSSLEPDFEFGTDGPLLILVGVDGPASDPR